MKLLTVDYESKNASKEFLQSLKDTGFAVLTNHPITKELIEETYSDWEVFFGSDAKNDFLFNKDTQDGFFPFKTENAKGATQKDLKEFYHIFPRTTPPPQVKKSTDQIFAELQKLATELLNWIEAELPEDVRNKLSMPLSQMIENSPETLLRILHYPPLSGDPEDAGAVRAAAHGDINLITLLLTSTEPGLQVLSSTNEWYEVPCNYGQIAINVGDMLEMATGGYLKSTQHRVVNPTNPESMRKARYSMPLFLHPKPDVRLSKTHTAGEFLAERLKEIGLQ